MPNYPKGDWMKPYEADEKIAARAREDWEFANVAKHLIHEHDQRAFGTGPELTMEHARARVKAWTRRDGWAEKAVAVIGVNRAAGVYFDTYNALTAGGAEKKTCAQLEAEIAEVLARRKSW